jgi:uncharacterized protein with von Willebrand factor type A (vWA) domain
VTAVSTIVETLVGFARTLRAVGVDASPDRMHAMLDALDHLDVLDSGNVYWAGRLTLCGCHDDLARYDRTFAAYFAGERGGPLRRAPAIEIVRPVAVPAAVPAPDEGEGDDAPQRTDAAAASRVEILRRRDFATLTAAERAEVRRHLALLSPSGPVRPSRRYQRAHRGPLDVRRTVRATLRRGGEPVRMLRRRHRPRARRLVLIVDVSGSMAPYADALLRFAHAAARRRPGTEVFTLGTRMTRVSAQMRERDPGAALAAVAEAIPDWSGGTRLGELVKLFLDRWGQRGLARGAVVVVASDGWERGDATLLGEQMARLRRLAHRVVWVNPHKARPGYAPLTAGMAAALPHVDDFVEGHSLAALAELAGVLSAGRRGG